MKRERDSQRSKLYRAEKESGHLFTHRIEEVSDIQNQVDLWLSNKKLLRHYPSTRAVAVLDGCGFSRAKGTATYIQMPRWSRTTLIILHELAHSIHQSNYGVLEEGHGWRYASIYLNLVLWFMGRKEHDDLKRSFRANSIRFRPKRQGTKRPMPQAAIDGLKRWRETQAAARQENEQR